MHKYLSLSIEYIIKEERGGNLKISKLPPLVFYFKNSNNFIDAMSAAKRLMPNFLCDIYKGKGYYLILTTNLKSRQNIKFHLMEFGDYLGSGSIFTAYLEEHGATRLSSELTLPVPFND